MVVSIVIPVHNRKSFTRDCLRSLGSQTVPADNIIIVDDGSTDDTKEMLSKEFPEVIVLTGDGNLFWTAAINKGIRHALSLGSDYIITLNNDTISPPAFLENMIRGALEKDNALIGALDIDMTTHKPHYGGEIINWKLSKSTYLLKTLKAEEQTGLHEVSLFPARGLLIPRRVFETIGLFEEKKLPHYMADYDFTHRAKRYGFPVFCTYDAKLFTYPEEGGDRKIRKRKTLKSYLHHLFGLKGGGNLKNFTIYTIRNCPPKFMLPSLLTGSARRLGGFWLK
jgi:GT2 family glycosyltransferase